MADAARLRWLILGCALVGTVVACLVPADEAAPHVPRAVRLTRAAMPVTHSPAAQSSGSDRVDVDPFSPRGWLAEIPPPPVTFVPPAPAGPVFVGPTRPPPPEPPAPPPPLPFQFMGRLNDGAAPVVYLSRGDQTIVARVGETIEQTYKVLSLNALQIEFMYMPTGEKQLMSLPAPGD